MYTDPFGLCPEERRDKKGRCPGGLSVREWQQVEAASEDLRQDAGEQIVALLNEGKISGGRLRPSHAGETNWITGRITLNRSASYGSTFEHATQLGHTLGHELKHVQQVEGKGFLGRFWMQAKYGFAKGFTEQVEKEADSYACEVGPKTHAHCK